MEDVQQQITCPAAGGWIQGAERGSRAEGSRQPEKCPGNRTMSDSNLLDCSVVKHKEKGSLSIAELRYHQVLDWARWHVHSAGLSRIAL